jgi:hypothetical protein
MLRFFLRDNRSVAFDDEARSGTARTAGDMDTAAGDIMADGVVDHIGDEPGEQCLVPGHVAFDSTVVNDKRPPHYLGAIGIEGLGHKATQ